jgi:hypothetical protein
VQPLFSDQVGLLFVTSLFTLLGTIVSLIVQLIREKRTREWQREDRRLNAAGREELSAKIDENTVVTQQAADIARAGFAEANHANDKIAQMTATVIDHPRLERIEEKVQNLVQRVPTLTVRGTDVSEIVAQRAEPGDRRTEESHVRLERRRKVERRLPAPRPHPDEDEVG